ALVVTGVLAALAAVVLTAQLGSGHPEVSSGYLLPAFAAAFLGAAVSRTGTASFVGALYGALLLQCVTNELAVCNAPSWSQSMVQVSILILAVAVSQAMRLRARRAGALCSHRTTTPGFFTLSGHRPRSPELVAFVPRPGQERRVHEAQ